MTSSGTTTIGGNGSRALRSSLSLDLDTIFYDAYDGCFYLSARQGWISCRYAHLGYDSCRRNSYRYLPDITTTTNRKGGKKNG